MNFSDSKINTSTYIDLYTSMLLPRMIEEKMLILLRQGKISKWFSGIGQEAISVGVAKALEKEEFIFPMHRNLGVFTSRDIPSTQTFFPVARKKQRFYQGT
jgi:2-oxoisovalerate dehydrogenase E1 component